MHVFLDKFQPRNYQMRLLDAIENKGYKKAILVWPRRAGKDIVAFNLAIRSCLRRKQSIFMVYPTYKMARKIIYDSLDIGGNRIIDYYIPEEVVLSKNSTNLKITFKNNSQLQLVGADNPDRLVGVNLHGCIFSEFALLDSPLVYQLIKPILLASDGWCLFISTPRGRNHFHDLFKIAQEHPEEWFSELLTVRDTKHISEEDIQKDIDQNVMTEKLSQQEYYCSFEGVYSGSFYGVAMEKMHHEGRITDLYAEPNTLVHTAWDIGVRDSTSIIFYQVVHNKLYILDYYENSGQGLDHYVNVLKQKNYTYGYHIAPHDIKVKEFGSGLTRLEQAGSLGINFTICPSLTIIDGIESVRQVLNRTLINKKCKMLILALENYRAEFDEARQVFKDKPLHDKHSHGADAMRYLCVSLAKISDGLSSADELKKRYLKTLYGSTGEDSPFELPPERCLYR